MKYLVMECHYSYAIVLDEDGCFLKVANMHYEVGQTVENIIEMQEPDTITATPKKSSKRWITSLAAMAACLIIMLTTVFQLNQSTYASVYMRINPAVRIDINKKDMVVGMEGINEDGMDLIKEYSYKKKNLNQVMDELVDRAILMGYLSDGDQISLTLDAENDEWVVTRSDELNTHLNEYLKDKMTVTIQITDDDDDDDTKSEQKTTEEKKQTIVIPVSPDDNDSNYDDSDYGTNSSSKNNSTTKNQNTSGDSSYDSDSAYDSDDNGSSNYDDSNDDAASNYDDSSDDATSNYDDSDDDTASNYDDSSDDTASNYDDSSDDAASNYDDSSHDASNYDTSDTNDASNYDTSGYDADSDYES